MQVAIIAISFIVGMAAGVIISCLIAAKRQQEYSDEKITDVYNKGYCIGSEEDT